MNQRYMQAVIASGVNARQGGFVVDTTFCAQEVLETLGIFEVTD